MRYKACEPLQRLLKQAVPLVEEQQSHLKLCVKNDTDLVTPTVESTSLTQFQSNFSVECLFALPKSTLPH